MLVSAKEMLTKAKEGHYAVGQFNINNLEWTKSILLTAQEMNSPVILGVSEGAGKYMCGYKTVVVKVEDGVLTVNIGSVDHPMAPEHFIEWVYVQTEKGGMRKSLQPGSAPNVCPRRSENRPPRPDRPAQGVPAARPGPGPCPGESRPPQSALPLCSGEVCAPRGASDPWRP